MNLNCIAVDDEPLSLDILENYIRNINKLDLIATCNDAMEALEVLRNHQIDLIFLDINMPGISGFQLLKSLSDPPQIIFTTAYPEFAVRGFEVDAIDYLVKPFPFERFLKAVNKVLNKKELQVNNSKDQEVIWLKAEKKNNRILINDILYVEAVGDYVKVKTLHGQLIIHETMHGILDRLKDFGFIRVHRSFIISPDKIDFIEGNRVSIKNESIPVGQAYRENLEEKLKH